MNKKQILQQLHDTANQLEKKGLYAEANVLTNVMTRVAQQPGQSNLNTLYNNFQQTPQQPNQAPQQPGNMQQFWGQGQNNESNYRNYKPLSDQFDKIYFEIYNNFKKTDPIMDEINRKIDSELPLQQSKNGFQAIVMCNNILHQNKTLQTQLQNVFNQILKLHNPFNPNDSLAISGYQKNLNDSQHAIYRRSEIVNKFNSKMKQYQPNQTQKPNQAQQPVQTPK
jgi:hypothetical protein